MYILNHSINEVLKLKNKIMSYPFSIIEPKWQQYWDNNKTNKQDEPNDKPKYYILDMFPYPSGDGLHIGHPEGYTATDIIARYKKMKGFNILHPMGFDAFGLPAERHAMQTGEHPSIQTKANIKNFTKQLKMLGLNYDWDNIINTTEPDYFKWTQWMFILIYNAYFDKKENKAKHIDELEIPKHIIDKEETEKYKDSHRLAYIDNKPVNWCEELGTVLANEEVEEWRAKGYTVERRPMRQWMIKITEYAQRLLDDLDTLDWPRSTMDMQKHWIGKSEGAEIEFNIAHSNEKILVFTTRPDTIFGATFMVIAPENELVTKITTKSQSTEINEYIAKCSFKSDVERQEAKEKTGVFTGSYAVNPATNKNIPILIADYVLNTYGTGAIMAVPGHDERDHAFAQAFNLDIVQVVGNLNETDYDIQSSAFVDNGVSINSENQTLSLNGLGTKEAKQKMIDYLVDNNLGHRKIQFRLRDWLFSRQRYWGEPIPIMYFEDGSKRALDLDELPLILPQVKEYKPAGTGESPLANVSEWVNFTDKKTGKKARFETNTMPQWSGSCWYYLRYIDPHNNKTFIDKEKEKYWMGDKGVDLYVGGAEHAVLHLLYARFWHKVLFDFGHISTSEPFQKLFHQGLIMGLSYKNKKNVLVANDKVEEKDGKFFNKDNGEELEEIIAKMSKSLKNVVNPDDIVKHYGADSLRLYEMFLGPLEQSKPWNTNGIGGVKRFLDRVWRMTINDEGELSDSIQDIELTPDQEFMLHSTIKKVSEDIENLSFNTAISQMMIFVNEFTSAKIKPKKAITKFILCLAPFAPHIAEEIWLALGNNRSTSFEDFPVFDESKTKKQSIEFVVQVTSKIRARLQITPDTNQEDIEKLAKADEKVANHLAGKTIRKVIFVPNKLINFIAT